MKRLLCLFTLLMIAPAIFAQFSSGQIEAYASAGLFSTKLSHDSLVPQRMHGKTRLGSLASYGIQYGVPVSKSVMLKAGIGYSTRTYSVVKYSNNLLFLFILPFGSYSYDSFPIARVQYHTRYLEVPLSFDYNVSRPKAGVQVHFGGTARLQFLANDKTTVTPDDDSGTNNNPAGIETAEKLYAGDVKKFVFTLEPYMDVSFRIYKGIGAYYRIKPFSLYASPLNNKVATREGEFLGSGVGLWYRF